MTHYEALSKLELEEGATSSEITAQYQEFYNEFQMRITNAPTEHQRKLYQKKLEELAVAFEVLGGESPESNTQELPGISESEIVETEKLVEQSVSHPVEISKEKAYELFGLTSLPNKEELDSKLKTVEADLAPTLTSSFEAVRKTGALEMAKVQEAYVLIQNDLLEFLMQEELIKEQRRIEEEFQKEEERKLQEALEKELKQKHELELIMRSEIEEKLRLEQEEKEIEAERKLKEAHEKELKQKQESEQIIQREIEERKRIEAKEKEDEQDEIKLNVIFVNETSVKVHENNLKSKPDEFKVKSSLAKRKWLLPVSIVGGLGILVLVILMNMNGISTNENEIIDPTLDIRYISLKSQADLLTEQENWQEALSKYKEVYLLVETSEVKDSVVSMKNHLLFARSEKEDRANEQSRTINTGKNKENEDNALKKKGEATNAKRELEEKEQAIIEAERIEKESKRIKIGDTYSGGIVFKVSSSGEHGLVCAPKNQGNLSWEDAITVCQNLTLNGYSDWYLPTRQELKLMYTSIGQGSSIGNVGGFKLDYYWSSMESVNNFAWGQFFGNGLQYDYGRNDNSFVRAVRAF